MYRDPYTQLLDEYGSSYRWYVLFAVTFGTFITVLSATLIDVVIPNVIDNLGIELTLAQWLASGFLLANTIFLLASARLTERFGIRIIFLSGLIAFILGAAIGSFASSASTLILSRVVQGAGAGLVQPLAVIAIARVFPRQRFGFAMGICGAGLLLGATLGPLFGGIVIDSFGWRYTYVLQLPLALLALALVVMILPDDRPVIRAESFDWLGLASLSSCLLVVMYWLTLLQDGNSQRAESAMVAMAAVTSISVLAISQRRERAPRRLIDITLLGRGNFAIVSGIAFAIGFALYGSLFLIPLYLQNQLDTSATISGEVLLPSGFLMVAITPFAGHLSDKVRPGWPVAGGLLLFAASLGCLTMIGPQMPLFLMAVALMIGRGGLVLLSPNLYMAALRSVSADGLPQASGLLNFSRQLGGSVGITALSLFISTRTQLHWDHLTGQVFNGFDFSTRVSTEIPAHLAKVYLTEAYYSLWANTYAFRDAFAVTAATVTLLAIATFPAMARVSTSSRVAEKPSPEG